PPGRHLLALVMARFFRGGSTAGQPWTATRAALDEAVAYLHRFYADLDTCLEWSAYQYVTAPQSMSWAWAPVVRHGLEVPGIDGLYLASSTLEARAAVLDIGAYAGLEAPLRALARLGGELREQRELAARTDHGVEVGAAEEAQDRVGDRPELLGDVVVVVRRCGRLAHRLGPGARHEIGDDAAARAGLLARRLHVRRRRLRVLGEWLADRLPVGELGVEAAGAQLRDEGADEFRDGTVVEDEVQELALEAARHLAPVAPHGLEPDDLERLARGSDHEPRVALLAAHGAAADLGHEEARVDLLELELEVARATEVAGEGGGDVPADPVAQLLGPRRSARGVRLPGVDEARVGAAVRHAVAALGDGRGGEPDDVLAGRRDRVRHRRREEPRRRRAEHAEERVHEDLDRLRGHLVAGAARARPLPREPR